MALDIILTADHLTKISTLSKKVQSKVWREVGEMEWSRCADDPTYWLDPTRHPLPYVYTQEHHIFYQCNHCPAIIPFNKCQVHLENTHKQLGEMTKELALAHFTRIPSTRPFEMKCYFYPLIEQWLYEPMMLVEKSRDMMATWLFLSLFTWDTLFHDGRQNFVQSESASKTFDLLKRCKFIYDHQPKWLKTVHPMHWVKGEKGAGIIHIPTLNSELQGLPKGADQIRQYHPTGVFTDETAFHPDAGEVFAAVQPSIRNGGRYTGVSSAYPGWFQLAASDDLELDKLF